jgi:hypothetical protein
MKKLIYSILFICFSLCFANAQIVPEVTEAIYNFENVDLSDEYAELIIENYLANESNEDINLRWTFVEGTCPEEWDFFKFDENMTYVPTVVSNVDPDLGINFPVTLEAGETESYMFLFLAPRQVVGCCQVAYEFSDADDPTATPIATATYDIFVNSPDCEIISNTFEAGNNSFDIYPNPTHGIVNIKAEIPIAKINAFSVAGQDFGEIFTAQNNDFDLSHLPGGLYFLKIKMENGKTGWARINKI